MLYNQHGYEGGYRGCFYCHGKIYVKDFSIANRACANCTLCDPDYQDAMIEMMLVEVGRVE